MNNKLNQNANSLMNNCAFLDYENEQVSTKVILIRSMLAILVIFLCADLFPHPALKSGVIVSWLTRTQQQLQTVNPKITTSLSCTNNR
jgi:hypothetical protein